MVRFMKQYRCYIHGMTYFLLITLSSSRPIQKLRLYTYESICMILQFKSHSAHVLLCHSIKKINSTVEFGILVKALDEGINYCQEEKISVEFVRI